MSETERRRAIAERIVGGLAADARLSASILVGSAARGTSDEHSDIDLLNYYSELPAVEQFDAVLAAAGAEKIGELGPPGPEQFAARYRVDGIEVQSGGQLASSMDELLTALEAGEVDWATAKVATGLIEALPLHGEELVRRWRERARYPEALRRREVRAHLGFFPIWRADAQLAHRDAQLFRRQMLLDGAFRVLAVLSAVNRLYFSTFQFKSQGEHVRRMQVRPERLAERLDAVANAPAGEAARELEALVDEVRQIVRAELPDVDVDVPWTPGAP